MINAENLSKVFSRDGTIAVDSVSFTINDGEILGFAGLNGAGKTTTIRMMAGVSFPTSGKVLVDGYDVVNEKVKASRTTGWVPEIPNFEANVKPLQLLTYYGGFFGMERDEVRKRGGELLEEFGLGTYVNKRLKTYSQGMKKRMMMVSCLLSNPQNLLFDETLNGLDPEGVYFMRNKILDLKKQGKAVLLSSHILSELESVADRVLIIHHGKIVGDVTREDLRSFRKASALKIIVENPDDRLKDILERYGDVTMDGKYVEVRNVSAELSEINKLLLKENYSVSSFGSEGSNLENYFFEKLGVKK